MKKQFLPILFAAASMQASFVTSNGKKAFGYEDAQVIIRPNANLHLQGVYARVLGTAGSEKLYAFGYNINGDHEFYPKSKLISALGYDSRWAALFEDTLPEGVLAFRNETQAGINVQILSDFGVNQRPNFEAFANGSFAKAFYPTTSGIILANGGTTVSGQVAPLSRDGVLPRDANGGIKIYTEPTATSADTTAKTGVAGWWAGRQTWEKGLIVAGILGLVVLALRKIKI